MKRGHMTSICLLILFFALVSSLIADEQTANFQSRILETFDNPEESRWIAQGSKFATEGYPEYTFANAWPVALYRGIAGEVPEEERLVFGVHCKFDRKGYNYIEIIPVEENADGELVAREVTIPGRIRNMDVWVWGSNHDYYLEAHFMDFTGRIHILNFGDIRFLGWRNLRINIPNYIPQAVSYAPALKGLSLVKLVIWTKPHEKVDDFYVYFDQIKIFTDLFETPFDGEVLTQPETLQAIWAEADS